MPGQVLPYIIAGNTFADIPIVGMTGRTIAITNPGSSWVHFPQSAGAYAWVPPRWYGVIMPCPISMGSLRVDLTTVPSSVYVHDTSDLTAAQITIHEDALPFSPGQSLLAFLPPTAQPQKVEVVDQSSDPLGDPTTAPFLPDTLTELITQNTGTVLGGSAIMASFKPLTGQFLKQIGILGAFTSGASPLTPTFGQNTTAGNFLVAWAAAVSASAITTAASGWVRQIERHSANGTVALFYKVNCSAAESAPAFTNATVAQLAEFSQANASPVDQSAGAVVPNGAISETTTLVNAAADAVAGDLVIAASVAQASGSSTATFVDTWNNAIVNVHAGDNGATSGLFHSSFNYGIVPQGIASEPLMVQLVPDPARVSIVQPNKKVTYTATFRLAARPYALSNAFGAAGRKQYATLFHPLTAVKTVKLRHAIVALESSSAAAIVMADLVRLNATTTPATGNPAITPTPANPNDAAAEATTLALPTTAGTEGAVWNTAEWDLGITGAASTVNPPPALALIDLVNPSGLAPDEEAKLPLMRPGNAEGWAVILDASAATTVKGYVTLIFTEE